MMTKKILLLHGNRQTGQLLLGRLDPFRKRLGKELEVELIAPDAPFELAFDSQKGEKGNSLQLTWWERHETIYQGLEETLDLFKSPSWNDDDIIGIMGFSQGARLLHLLLILRQNQATTNNSDIPTSPLLPCLKFVILVSGYDAPLPDNFPWQEPGRIALPSLHVFGENDSLILPEQSKTLMDKYIRPHAHSHRGSHFVPTKKPDVDIYMDFIRASLIPPQQEDLIVGAIIDEEAATMQAEEVQSLMAMFPDEIIVKSGFEEDSAGDFRFQYPIRYHVKMNATDPDESSLWPIHPLTIQVTYPITYPLETVPHFQLIHQNTNFEFPSNRADKVLRILHDTSQLELGMPSVLSGVYNVQAYLDRAPMEDDKDLHRIHLLAQKFSNRCINDNGREQQRSIGHSNGYIVPSPPKMIAERNREGLEIAEQILKKEQFTKNVSPASRNAKSDGGSWNYVIGLIGKPSAGK
jgi:hypothetical protein